MTSEAISARQRPADPTAGRIALASGIIAAVGVVFLVVRHASDLA